MCHYLTPRSSTPEDSNLPSFHVRKPLSLEFRRTYGTTGYTVVWGLGTVELSRTDPCRAVRLENGSGTHRRQESVRDYRFNCPINTNKLCNPSLQRTERIKTGTKPEVSSLRPPKSKGRQQKQTSFRFVFCGMGLVQTGRKGPRRVGTSSRRRTWEVRTQMCILRHTQTLS